MSAGSRPRVLFVARTRYRLPLDDTLRRRFDALSEELDWHQLATSQDGPAVRDTRFTLVGRFPVGRLDGLVFHALLPFRVARELRRRDPDVVVVQGAQDTALTLLARRLARSRAAVIFDVHGDWRNDTRVYGSPLRRALSPFTDALARVAVRRSDGVRTVSAFTTSLVREQGAEPAAEFPAYMDLEPFARIAPAPFPSPPRALFVGVLERYKAVDVLAAAWPTVAAALPSAELHLVGRGAWQALVERMVAEGAGRVRWTPRLSTGEVADALDEATLLVLPSRREGMGRVIVEAFCRGRPVVGTDSGGIPDLVQDGVNGLLVPVEDAAALAEAMIAVLGDPGRASTLGAAAQASSGRWAASPAEFARRTRELVETVAARRRS